MAGIIRRVLILCSIFTSISSIEIACNQISSTQSGRQYCFIRDTIVEQNTTITYNEDRYADNRKELIFDNCSFYALPSGLFENYPNLHTIYMWNTGVRAVLENNFGNAGHLKTLDLTRNNITQLDGQQNGVFSLAPNLHHLDISHNQIEKVTETTFLGLKMLTRLNLQYNRIDAIAMHTFDPLTRLSEIYLNQNKIKRIESNLFEKNLRLTHIQLNDNKIEFLNGEHSFKHLTMMNNFACHNNPIQNLTHITINSGAINVGNTGAIGLYIGNRATKVEAADNNIQYIIVANHSTELRTLNLANNHLTSISNITHYDKMIHLHLSNNHIKDIGINSFSGMHNLQTLDLKNSGLTSVSYGLFSHKSKLNKLDLSYNQLGRIDFDMFITMENLKTLYLEGNNITNLDMSSVRKHFPTLKLIGISQNNWWCANLAMIIKYLESAKIKLNTIGLVRNVENINGIPCTSSQISSNTVAPIAVEHISYYQSSPVDDEKLNEIQTLQKNCQFSLTNANDMELIIQLIQLKYEVNAYHENVKLISNKIDAILDSMQHHQKQ